MELYHISLDLEHNGIFELRIPENAHFYGEESHTPRICFASSLEGCLTALPLGVYNLAERLEESENIIKVFKLDLSKYNIPNHNVISPETLFSKKYVSDARVTGEHWITKSLKFQTEDFYLAKVLSFDTACVGKEGIKPASQFKSGDVDIVTNLKLLPL